MESVWVGAFYFVPDGGVEVSCLALFGYLLGVVVVVVIVVIVVFVFIVFVFLSLLLFVFGRGGCRCGRFFVAFVLEQIDDTD